MKKKERNVTDTDTTKRKSLHKLLISRIIPDTISVVIPLVNQTTEDMVAASGGNLHARRMILSKEIVADVAHSAAHVFKYPQVVNRIDKNGTILRDGKTVLMPPILTNPVWICAGPSVSPTRMGSQDIGSPRGSISPQ